MPDTINVFDVLCNGTDFFLLLSIGIVFAALCFTQRANGRFQQTFAYFLQVPSAAGLTALEVARRLLEHAGLNGVRVTPGTGLRGRSQYHPIAREITLAQNICTNPSLAALGVAAHEVGHALQHARGYRFAWMRKVLVPVVYLCFLLAIAMLVFGVISGSIVLLWTSMGFFASCTVFSIVTLPAE